MKSSIEIFEDVRSSYSNWNAWKPEFSFPLEELEVSFSEILILAQLTYQSSSMGQNDDIWGNAIRAAYGFLNTKEHKVIYIGENGRLPRNRIRSYKGVVPKELRERVSSIELEFDASNGHTIIGALIDLDGVNEKDFEQLCFACPHSFILTAEHTSCFNSEFLELILSDAVCYSGDFAYLNFVSLVSKFVDEDSMLLRFGGDGGDQEVSVQFFFNRNGQVELELDLQKLR